MRWKGSESFCWHGLVCGPVKVNLIYRDWCLKAFWGVKKLETRTNWLLSTRSSHVFPSMGECPRAFSEETFDIYYFLAPGWYQGGIHGHCSDTPFASVCVRWVSSRINIKPLKFERQEICEKIIQQVIIFLRVDCDPKVQFYLFQMCVIDKWSSVWCVVLSDPAWKTKVLSVLCGQQSSHESFVFWSGLYRWADWKVSAVPRPRLSSARFCSHVPQTLNFSCTVDQKGTRFTLPFLTGHAEGYFCV